MARKNHTVLSASMVEAINDLLKPLDFRFEKSQDSRVRYLIKKLHRYRGLNKQGREVNLVSRYTVGKCYGEDVLLLLSDPTMRARESGDTGWHDPQDWSRIKDFKWAPVSFSREQMLMLKLSTL